MVRNFLLTAVIAAGFAAAAYADDDKDMPPGMWDMPDCGACHTSAKPVFGIISAAVAEGRAFYENQCASFHGPLASSNVRKASSRKIAEAVMEDEGGMGAFASYSTQFDKISMALSAIRIDGVGLYDRHCASCHGDLATGGLAASRKKLKDRTIERAIRNNVGGMGSLALTKGELKAISKVIEKAAKERRKARWRKPAPAPAGS